MVHYKYRKLPVVSVELTRKVRVVSESAAKVLTTHTITNNMLIVVLA